MSSCTWDVTFIDFAYGTSCFQQIGANPTSILDQPRIERPKFYLSFRMSAALFSRSVDFVGPSQRSRAT
jgi:hypothetical protein